MAEYASEYVSEGGPDGSGFRRVLVTGGAGFIGSNFVRHALDAHPDWRVTVLDKLTYAGNPENLDGLGERMTFVEGDIAAPPDVQAAFTTFGGAPPDAILNFAAESHVDRSLMDPRPFVRTNVEGTLVLLEAARQAGVRRFVQISTDEVYGDVSGTDALSAEDDRLQPRSPYAATKAAAEHIVFSYHVSYGMDVVVTRGSNTYGPRQYPEKIIPLFVTNALQDRPLPLYGRGEAVRDYLHVEDHCSGIDAVLHRGRAGQAYNLGARLEVPGTRVAEAVLDALDKPRDLIAFVPDRPGHDYRYAVNPSRAEALRWRRKWSFDTGIAATVRWYVENDAWWRRVKDRAAFRDHETKWYTQRT